jgi:CO/xanthine dehydrogenase FAD-binding subunit
VGVEEYVLAATAEEAVRLAGVPGTAVMGGGTTVMPAATAGTLGATRVVGLLAAGLDGVRRPGALAIGAMTTLDEIAELDALPALARAAGAVGGWALRRSATIGGNLLVGAPYGDLAPVLLAYDAELRIAGPGGQRTVALAEALAGTGAVVAAGEILTEILVPPPPEPVTFLRCARRASNSPAVVTVATRVRRAGAQVADARIALGGAGPRAFRATAAEQALIGGPGDAAAIAAAARAAREASDPPTDALASSWYRRRMVELFAGRALAESLAEERR